MKRKVRLPLVIGQAPGRPTDAGYLSPFEGPCGERLASLLGIKWRHFMTMVERANLIQEWPGKSGRGDKFPRARGTISALAMVMRGQLDNRKVVLLGKEVARCFGLADMRYLETRTDNQEGGIESSVFLLPHPSGVNRWWNSKRNVLAASKAFKVFLGI